MKISDIIIVILFVLSLIIVAWYLLGNSPTFEQTILILILGGLIANTVKTAKIGVELRVLRSSFNNMAKDFKEQKSKNKK